MIATTEPGDLSGPIGTMLEGVQSMIADNAGALFSVLALFVGLELVLRLIDHFRGRKQNTEEEG